MGLNAYIEAISDSDFAPLAFYRQISDAELRAIGDARKLIGHDVSSINLEPDKGAACCAANTGSCMLVTQSIHVYADHISFTLSDPAEGIEFESRPIGHQDLAVAIERSASPCRKGEVFLGFGENTGVLEELLDDEFNDRDDPYPGSDRLLTPELLALVYGDSGEHAALDRAAYQDAEDKAQLTYWQWLDSRLGKISDHELQMLNAVAPDSIEALRRELAELESKFNAGGGRGVDLAEEIDRLRSKIEALDIPEAELALPLRPSDRQLCAEQLALRYEGSATGEHLAFPKSDWLYEASNDGTTAGYWAWLEGRLETLTDEEVEDINTRLRENETSCNDHPGPGF